MLIEFYSFEGDECKVNDDTTAKVKDEYSHSKAGLPKNLELHIWCYKDGENDCPIKNKPEGGKEYFESQRPIRRNSLN